MREIQLSKGYVALVDDADYEALGVFKWSAAVRKSANSQRVYACRVYQVEGYQTMVLMHKFLAGLHGLGDVDHRDGNGLNNQRLNLRSCSRTQNNANAIKRRRGGQSSSRFIGVSHHRETGKWGCQLKKRHIGLFRDEADAATAYNFAALEEYGEFARFNAP